MLSVTERRETRVEFSSSDSNVTHDISSSSHSDDLSASPWPISGWKSVADVCIVVEFVAVDAGCCRVLFGQTVI